MSPDKVTKPLDIYVRVSDTKGRKDKGEAFQSPAEQEEKARALCSLKGYKVGKVFTDLDQSGGKMSRPAFDEAMRRALNGESGGIVVAKLDRFARNVAGLLEYVDRLENAGAVWGCAQPTIDTGDPELGRFLLTLFGAMAELELGRIKRQWTSSKETAVKHGKHVSAFPPPGYERHNGHLTPHPKHAKTIAKAFELAASGTAPAEIAAYLTEQGLPSGKNERPEWKSSRISRLLANRVYLGEARASGDIVNPTAHEPLTDPATFALAQRKSKAVASGPANHLLSGLVRCASCSAAMRGQKESQWAPAAYRCTTGGAGGKCPSPSTITMSRLDDLVYELWAERMFDKQPPPEQEEDDSESLAAVAAAEQALADLEAKRGELHPIAFAEAQTALLNDVEAARLQVAERSQRQLEIDSQIRDAFPQLVEQVKATIAEASAYLEAGKPLPAGFFLDGLTEDGKRLVRHGLSREIQAIFVRPPARRSKSLPIANRVKVVWRDDYETLELPSRGSAWTPRPYTWESA